MKKTLIILSVLALLAGGCGQTTKKPSHKICEINHTDNFYYLDVIGDNSLDTIIVSNNKTNPSIRDIYWVENGKRDRIISIKPWRDSTFVLTQPPIEAIYLEANEAQTGEKGLRIILRNTDIAPDCIFIDIYYDDTWMIKRYYLLNTEPYFGIDLFIKYIDIDKPVFIECGEDLICNPKLDINYKYFIN